MVGHKLFHIMVLTLENSIKYRP